MLFVLAGCTGGPSDESPNAPPPDPSAGSPARSPAYAWPTVSLVEGQTLPQVLEEGGSPADIQVAGGDFDFASLGDLKGKRVFMTFWNTWCPYCREVLPQYDQLRKDLDADDIVWMFVNNVPNEHDGTPGKIDAYLEETGLTTPIVLDTTGNVARAYGARGVPTTVVLDADGKIVVIFPGAAPYDLAKLALEVAADPSVLDELGEPGGD